MPIIIWHRGFVKMDAKKTADKTQNNFVKIRKLNLAKIYILHGKTAREFVSESGNINKKGRNLTRFRRKSGRKILCRMTKYRRSLVKISAHSMKLAILDKKLQIDSCETRRNRLKYTNIRQGTVGKGGGFPPNRESERHYGSTYLDSAADGAGGITLRRV